MDRNISELLSEYAVEERNNIARRPPMSDLRNEAFGINRIQKKHTYNLLNLDNSISLNFISPPLHIKLGLVSKVLQILDEVNVIWNREVMWIQMENKPSPIDYLMRQALSEIKVKRQNYYSGQIDDRECNTFMLEMKMFCDFYFDAELPCKSLGVQIVEDLQYNAFLSLPQTKILRSQAEEKCVLEKRPLKKWRYS